MNTDNQNVKVDKRVVRRRKNMNFDNNKLLLSQAKIGEIENFIKYLENKLLGLLCDGEEIYLKNKINIMKRDLADEKRQYELEYRQQKDDHLGQLNFASSCIRYRFKKVLVDLNIQKKYFDLWFKQNIEALPYDILNFIKSYCVEAVFMEIDGRINWWHNKSIAVIEKCEYLFGSIKKLNIGTAGVYKPNKLILRKVYENKINKKDGWVIFPKNDLKRDGVNIMCDLVNNYEYDFKRKIKDACERCENISSYKLLCSGKTEYIFERNTNYLKCLDRKKIILNYMIKLVVQAEYILDYTEKLFADAAEKQIKKISKSKK